MCEFVGIEKDYNETSINWYLLVPDKKIKKRDTSHNAKI